MTRILKISDIIIQHSKKYKVSHCGRKRMDRTTVLITTHMQQLCNRWRNCVVTMNGKDSARSILGLNLRLKFSDQSLC